jgi:hypothetical protein
MACWAWGARAGVQRQLRPNNSFKPNLLRSSISVAEKACHASASTTQVGLIQVLAVMTNNLALAVLFLIPFAAVLRIWSGVRIWQVGVIALVFGTGYGTVVAVASYGTDLALGSIFGPGPEGWLARRLACAAGLASSGLVALVLTLVRQRPSTDS